MDFDYSVGMILYLHITILVLLIFYDVPGEVSKVELIANPQSHISPKTQTFQLLLPNFSSSFPPPPPFSNYRSPAYHHPYPPILFKKVPKRREKERREKRSINTKKDKKE